MDSILEGLYYEGPRLYTRCELAGKGDLFRERTGLFFTPTGNIPAEWVGENRLDVVLPLASPTRYEWESNPAFRVPRLWVDLLQRATGRLRWTPISPAKVTIVRYDTSTYDIWAVHAGAKALVDALIEKAAGRRDGRILHYFGAIRDDNSRDLTHQHFCQEKVEKHTEARTRVIVEPAPSEEVERPGVVLSAPGVGRVPC